MYPICLCVKKSRQNGLYTEGSPSIQTFKFKLQTTFVVYKNQQFSRLF
jgi:hypothetical protein